MFRGLDIERFDIFEESVFIRLCEGVEGDPLGNGSADGFVIDIGEVHHLCDRHSKKLDGPSEDIFEHIGAEVTDMGIVVYRRPARIHADMIIFERFEDLFLPR